MSDDVRLPPLLLGLFRELVANGVPLGVRDYLDGIRALRLGFGHGDRHALRDLAQALWVRSDEERRLVARWFAILPVAEQALLDQIDAALAEALPADADDSASGPQQRRALAAGESGGSAVPRSPAGSRAAGVANAEGDPNADAASRALARLSFASTREGSGLPVPRLPAEPQIGEDYVLHPHTLFSSRELAVLWRRFRRSSRRGPRSELDLAATIRERCQRGLLQQPVCRPRRRNSARLLVLADASASMDPWRPFLTTLAESLPFARLASAELRYFSNLPRKQLFATAELENPESRAEILRRHAGAGLLVVSDAGCARGYLNRRRAVQTATFLAEAAPLFPGAVWLNPMPRSRWPGTTAALVAAASAVPMLPLDAANLLRAIDILRGNK